MNIFFEGIFGRSARIRKTSSVTITMEIYDNILRVPGKIRRRFFCGITIKICRKQLLAKNPRGTPAKNPEDVPQINFYKNCFKDFAEQLVS